MEVAWTRVAAGGLVRGRQILEGGTKGRPSKLGCERKTEVLDTSRGFGTDTWTDGSAAYKDREDLGKAGEVAIRVQVVSRHPRENDEASDQHVWPGGGSSLQTGTGERSG